MLTESDIEKLPRDIEDALEVANMGSGFQTKLTCCQIERLAMAARLYLEQEKEGR